MQIYLKMAKHTNEQALFAETLCVLSTDFIRISLNVYRYNTLCLFFAIFIISKSVRLKPVICSL